MSKRKKILGGIFALVIGLSVAMPMRASADDWHHHHDSRADHAWRADRDHRWRWDRYEDHYRAYPNAPGYAYGERGYIPPNGSGMIDRQNPNLYWACDSDGHHCHWAPRF